MDTFTGIIIGLSIPVVIAMGILALQIIKAKNK